MLRRHSLCVFKLQTTECPSAATHTRVETHAHSHSRAHAHAHTQLDERFTSFYFRLLHRLVFALAVLCCFFLSSPARVALQRRLSRNEPRRRKQQRRRRPQQHTGAPRLLHWRETMASDILESAAFVSLFISSDCFSVVVPLTLSLFVAWHFVARCPPSSHAD